MADVTTVTCRYELRVSEVTPAERTVFSGGWDEACGRLLIGASVGEVGDGVSFEERRHTASLTASRQQHVRLRRGTVGAAQFRRVHQGASTSRRLVHVHAAAHNSNTTSDQIDKNKSRACPGLFTGAKTEGSIIKAEGRERGLGS